MSVSNPRTSYGRAPDYNRAGSDDEVRQRTAKATIKGRQFKGVRVLLITRLAYSKIIRQDITATLLPCRPPRVIHSQGLNAKSQPLDAAVRWF
jgi:hypothetical protein